MNWIELIHKSYLYTKQRLTWHDNREKSARQEKTWRKRCQKNAVFCWGTDHSCKEIMKISTAVFFLLSSLNNIHWQIPALYNISAMITRKLKAKAKCWHRCYFSKDILFAMWQQFLSFCLPFIIHRLLLRKMWLWRSQSHESSQTEEIQVSCGH